MNPQQQDPASPLRSDTLFSDTVPTALKRLVDRYGAELLAEPVRLRGLLADEIGMVLRGGTGAVPDPGSARGGLVGPSRRGRGIVIGARLGMCRDR